MWNRISCVLPITRWMRRVTCRLYETSDEERLRCSASRMWLIFERRSVALAQRWMEEFVKRETGGDGSGEARRTNYMLWAHTDSCSALPAIRVTSFRCGRKHSDWPDLLPWKRERGNWSFEQTRTFICRIMLGRDWVTRARTLLSTRCWAIVSKYLQHR